MRETDKEKEIKIEDDSNSVPMIEEETRRCKVTKKLGTKDMEKFKGRKYLEEKRI